MPTSAGRWANPFARSWKKATSRQREFKSKHDYTLEEFGLSKEWIQGELGEVMEAYGLEQ